MIRERQAEGIAAAKERDTCERDPKLARRQVGEVRERVEAGVAKARLACDLGVSRTTLYRALGGSGIYGRQGA